LLSLAFALGLPSVFTIFGGDGSNVSGVGFHRWAGFLLHDWRFDFPGRENFPSVGKPAQVVVVF
jgi:hypothetical protein